MVFKGLVAAAGTSSRMGSFKPLMELNGFPVIRMTVQSLKNAGIYDICVVVGRNADEVRSAISPMCVKVVENENYAVTDMMTSLRLGLTDVADGDGVFILPGDMPLIAPDTFGKLKKCAENTPDGTEAIIPVSGEKRMHPPLILKSGITGVAGYDGLRGLRGALDRMKCTNVFIEDAGAGLDADFREDFAVMEEYAKKHRGLSVKKCEDLFEDRGLPEHIRAHSRSVGELAAEIAESLVRHGYCLDIELCRSGGYLHDICRLEKNHAPAGGNYLRSLGYEALAGVVEGHMSLEEPHSVDFCENIIVFLADKLIMETVRTDPSMRYAKARERFNNSTPEGKRIRADEEVCRRLAERYKKITGKRLF